MDNTDAYELMFFAPTEGNNNFSCMTVQDRLQLLKRQLYEIKMSEVSKNGSLKQMKFPKINRGSRNAIKGVGTNL